MTLSPANRCNELHKGQYVLYLFKRRVHLRKKHLPGVTTTDTQESFNSLAIKVGGCFQNVGEEDCRA